MRLFAFGFLFLLMGWSLYSQEVYTYTKSEGLPSNTLYHVDQDDQGFLWCATKDGAARFNGRKFEVFNTLNGLGSNENFEVKFNASKSALFLGENGKLSSVDEEKKCSFDQDLSFSHFISEYLVTSTNRVIVSSFGNGIKIKQNNHVFHLTTQEGLEDDYVSFIWEWDGTIYAISRKGISAIDSKNKVSKVLKFENEIHFSRAVQLENIVFFSGSGRMYSFSKNEELSQYKDPDGLSHKTITKIQRVGGQLFCSTYNGAYVVKLAHDSIVVINSYFENEAISSVCKDYEGNFWFSTLNSGLIKSSYLNLRKLSDTESFGLLQEGSLFYLGLPASKYLTYSANQISEHQLANKNTYSNQKVKGIKKIRNQIWYELDGGLATVKLGETYFYRTGIAVIADFDSTIFVGNQLGCYLLRNLGELEQLVEKDSSDILIRDMAPNILPEKIYCFENYHDKLLIGGQSGLYFYSSKSIDTIWKPNDPLIHIASNKDELVLCFETHGAYYINQKDTVALNRIPGLSDTYFNHALILDDYIYLSSQKGLFEFSKESYTYKAILHDVETRSLSSYKNDLYISSESGLYITSIPFQDQSSYELKFEPSKIRVDGALVSNSFIQNLSHDQNDITFIIQAISFSNDPIIYKYRLNHEEWRVFNGELEFKELQPDFYQIEVQALCSGMSSKILLFKFEIDKPWWNKWWFYALVLVFVFLIVYWFFRVRILTYNRDIVQEMLQLILDRLKREKFILVKDIKDGSQTKIILSQLMYLESSKNYVTFYLNDKKIVCRATLKVTFAQLKNVSSDFVQVHRTYIVNLQKVEAVHGDFVKIKDVRIPLGAAFLDLAKEKFEFLKKTK